MFVVLIHEIWNYEIEHVRLLSLYIFWERRLPASGTDNKKSYQRVKRQEGKENKGYTYISKYFM